MSETTNIESSSQIVKKNQSNDIDLYFDQVPIAQLQKYKSKNTIRFVTATSLFDGHDASINIIRRILQSRGCEVVHLGHDRTAEEVATAAIQEDAHAIAISCYQGGHIEYFKYVRKILDDHNCHHIRILGVVAVL